MGLASPLNLQIWQSDREQSGETLVGWSRYLGVPCDERIVHVPFANSVSSDRGGEPRQARVCETLQKEAGRIHHTGATLVIWRCFGAALVPRPNSSSSLVDMHWEAYRKIGATGLQQAYQKAAQGAVERYNASHPVRERSSSDQMEELDIAENRLLESSKEEDCWPGLRPMVPGMLPIPCAYYDHDFLSQADADRLLSGLVGEQSEVVWAIGGQAAKRYTAVYCDDGLGEYAGGLGYANDVMRPWTPVLRELRDRVVAWHKQKTGRDVAFNVVR